VNAQAKKIWPKTPDGAIDWEMVFEDEASGFIPLIAKSQSLDALGQTTSVVIRMLFTRKGDEVEVQNHIKELNAIIAVCGRSGKLDAAKENSAGLLRKIKKSRIEKARAYVERKKRGAGLERRSNLFSGIAGAVGKALYDKLLSPKGLIALAGVLAVIVLIILYVVFEQFKGQIAGVEEEPAVTEKAKKKGPSGQEIKKEPPLRLVLLRPFHWPLSASREKNNKSVTYSILYFVEPEEGPSALCRNYPVVMDIVHQVFNRAHPKKGPTADEDLAIVGAQVIKDVNAKLRRDVVRRIKIYAYGDSRFQAAKRGECTVAADENK